MIVKKINLTHYRNYNNIQLELHPRMNIIIGDNGVGKTNILESLVFVSNTKSFRTNDDQELIQKEYDYARIDIESDKNKFRIIINKQGKNLMLNNSTIAKTSDFIGKLNVVLFKPNDLELFETSPRNRRRILDLEIGKISNQYLNAILVYNKLLKDKNNLLKQEKIDEIYLEVINEKMVDPIYEIIKWRQDFINFINDNINTYYHRLSNSDNKIVAEYDKCSELDKESIKEMITKNTDKDLFYHFTTVGPQKEDFNFLYDGYDVASYASQGQKRMIMIAFKFVLIDFIKKITNTTPVLLLDDILSELDISNKERLLNMIDNDIQTIITSTDVEGIKLNNKYRLFELRKDGNDK